MKILALITARGGSKRVPGKNIRILGSNPLIVWSINIAKEISDISDILVSTDDSAIAEVAARAGVQVPWLRPKELASDTASSVDVSLHALDWYESARGEVDGLMLLQPTSPFRSRETVQRGIDLYRRNPARPVVGMSPARSHPMWCVRVEGNTIRPFVDGARMDLRSQDLPPAYVLNGAFYLVEPGLLRSQRSFYCAAAQPLLIDDPEEAIDIDSEWDWKMAEAVLDARSALTSA